MKTQVSGFRFQVSGQRSRGFTLLELLIVIGIMALLMAVALPEFENFSKRGVSTAYPAVMSTLRLARQYAITHRKYVWVVFPDIGSNAGGGGATTYKGSQIEMALRSYAVIEGDENNIPSDYITEWKYLPQGIYFDAVKNVTNSVLKSYDGVGMATTYYPFPDSGTSISNNMPAIQFRPNGHAYFYFGSGGWKSFANAQIYLMGGIVSVVTNTGSEGVTTPIVKVSTNDSEIRVFAQTGQLDYMQAGR